MAEAYFVELAIITITAVAIIGLMRLLRQPLIIGYILTGILLGPYFLNIAASGETIRVFSKIGVALLLFMVGLNLNPRVIKDIGRAAALAGLGQVLFTFLIGFALIWGAGFSLIQALYLAIALTFSSTIVIMKLLSDKGETETLYGKIAIGILIIQDVIAAVILMLISSFSSSLGISAGLINTAVNGLLLFFGLGIFGIYILPKLLWRIARSQEFLFLFALGWSLAIASLFHAAHFSIEIGALFAGMLLSLSPYRHEIGAKMKPLRDFFVVLFFVLLGSQVILADLRPLLTPALMLSLFVLIGNPLIVIILLSLLGYTKRTSFLTGLTVAQISEFSLILIGLGVSIGDIDSSILSLTTLIGIITIAGSSYLIIYAQHIYPRFAPYLGIFERKGRRPKISLTHASLHNFDVVLFGYNRLGYDILRALKKTRARVLVIDYNPETIAKLKGEGVPCLYGDANDAELLNELRLENAKIIISTIPDAPANNLLIREGRRRNPKIILLATSHQIEDARELYRAGATYVIIPHFLGGQKVGEILRTFKFTPKKFAALKNAHRRHLEDRAEAGHEHPAHHP